MIDQINQIIYRIIAQECERSPSKKLAEIWDSCKERLFALGLPHGLIDNISDTHLRSVFTWQLVPNPRYWQEVLDNKFYFYLIKIPSKRYHDLLNSLKTQLVDISFFICYGELDVIIRWVGNEESVDQIENLLTSWGASPATIEVRNIPLYYRYEIPNTKLHHNVSLNPEKIDHALASSPEDLEVAVIQELVNSGVILGTVYLENTHITNKIHAFVGIKFDGPIEITTRKQFERELLSINAEQLRDRHTRPLFSIYQCGLHYDYFLEIIAEDHTQLDAITDKIQRLHPRVFDTETLILAKAYLSTIRFSQRKHESIEKFAILRGIMRDTLTPLVDSLLQDFPDKLEIVFPKSDSETQFLALSLYRDIWLKNSHIKEQWFIATQEYFKDFICAILEKRSSQIQNSLFGLIRDIVEKQHRIFAETIVNNCFNGENSLLQRELKTDDANWQRWGLAKWANHVYPKWNDHKLYGAIVKFSEEFLQSLEFIGEVRNRLAHHPTVKEVEHLIQESRQIFYHSFQILKFLSQITPILEKPTISLNVVKNIAFSGPQSSYFELLRIVQKLHVDVRVLKQSMEQQAEQSDRRWGELVTKLTQLQSGITRIDQKTLEILEELVIPKISDSNDKKRAMQLIEYLRTTAENLPAEFIANLLWGLISSAFSWG